MYNEDYYLPRVYKVFIVHTTHDEIFIDEDEAWEAFEEYTLADWDPDEDPEDFETMMDRFWEEWIRCHFLRFHEITLFDKWSDEI